VAEPWKKKVPDIFYVCDTFYVSRQLYFLWLIYSVNHLLRRSRSSKEKLFLPGFTSTSNVRESSLGDRSTPGSGAKDTTLGPTAAPEATSLYWIANLPWESVSPAAARPPRACRTYTLISGSGMPPSVTCPDTLASGG